MTARDRAQQTGWAALAEGRWSDARALFEEELATAPDARALEGSSWAAHRAGDAAQHALRSARG